jgi:hypothetical protein
MPEPNQRKKDKLKELKEESDKLLDKLENNKNSHNKELKYHSV